MTINWRKSSYSGSSNDEMCVEVGELANSVAIRDSKDPDGGHLMMSGDQFRRLLQQIKHD